MLAPDSTLQGHYRITYIADERSDCIIYRAIDQRTAMRVLIAALTQPSETALADVQTLARQIVNVEAPGLLALRDHFAEGLTCYLVADDPGGQDLERVSRERGGPLPEDEVLRHIDRLLGALDALHARKPPMLLGDLRSSDIWSSPEGDLSLAPFGLVRSISAEPSAYRAPELSEAENEPTTSSDLYALGAVQYQLMTGWAPPTADARTAGTPLNSPRVLNARISALAEQMALRALELKPGNRYQQAREMRSALETVRLMAGKPLGATAPARPAEPPPQAQGYPPGAGPQAQSYPPGAGPQAIPPVMPPPSVGAAGGYGPPPPAAPYPSRPGGYPQPAPAYGQPQYAPAAPGQAQAPGGLRVNNTCLIAAVVALGLVAMVICVIGLYIAYLLATGAGAALPFGPSVGVAMSTPAPAPTAASQGAGEPAAPTAAPAASAAFTQTEQLEEEALSTALYSPEGEYLAVAVGTEIRLYDAASFEVVRTLTGHEGEVSTLAFTPAGFSPLLLASGSSDEDVVRLWNAATGEELATLEGHAGWIRSLAFSPDGRVLASGSTDATVRLWDVAGRSELAVLAGHTDFLGQVAFAPDGRRLASASRDGSVRLWDLPAGTPVAGFSFTTPPDPATSMPYWLTGLSYSPDSRLLAVGSTSGLIYMLDPESGQVRRELEGHTNWVIIRGVFFSPDGRTLATASLDGSLRLWNASSGAERAVLQRQGLRLLSMSWSADGQRIVTSSDVSGEVVIWDVNSREAVQTLELAQGAVTAMSYSDSGTVLATGGAGGTVRLHLLDEDRSLTIPGGAPTSQYLAFLSDTDLVAVSSSGQVVVLDLTQANTGESFEGLGGLALSVAASPDRSLVAAGSVDGEVVVWEAESRRLVRTLRGLRGPVSALAFSRDGGRLAAAANPTDGNGAPTVMVWNTRDGRMEHTVSDLTESVTGLALQAGGEILAATTSDGVLRLLDGATGEELRRWQAEEGQGWYSSLAFSPDGSVLATGAMDGSVEFWDPTSGTRLERIELDGGSILSLAFRRDGAQVAASTREGGVFLLDNVG